MKSAQVKINAVSVLSAAAPHNLARGVLPGKAVCLRAEGWYNENCNIAVEPGYGDLQSHSRAQPYDA